MHEAALGLRPPIAVGRDLNVAHRVGLPPCAGCGDPDRQIAKAQMRGIVHVATPPISLIASAASPPVRFAMTTHAPTRPRSHLRLPLSARSWARRSPVIHQ